MTSRDEPPRSPSGRVPKWVLDEAAGAPKPDTSWRAGGPDQLSGAGGGRRRPRHRVRILALSVVALVCVGVAAAGATYQLGLWKGDDLTAGPDTRPQFDGPPPGREEAARPLGTPPAVAVSSAAHAFLRTGPDGKPVAFDPCRPIHYVVRPDGAPPGAETLIADAVARLSEVTGLQFIGDGATDEAPSQRRDDYQPERYGNRWAPVLFAWQRPEDNPGLVGEIGALGENGGVQALNQAPVYVSGQVTLDAPQIASLVRDADGRRIARALLLQAMASLAGLAEVTEPGQLMSVPASSDVLDFAAGDLTGLAALGRGTCARWL